MNDPFFTCMFFLAAVAGTISGIYVGISAAVRFTDPRKKRREIKNTKAKRAESDTEEERASASAGYPAAGPETESRTEPGSKTEAPGDGEGKSAENVSHSYMGFVCDNGKQDAVSKIRAARKTQDNKYITKMHKKENNP